MTINDKWAISLIVHGMGYAGIAIGAVCAIWAVDPWPVWLVGMCLIAVGSVGEIKAQNALTAYWMSPKFESIGEAARKAAVSMQSLSDAMRQMRESWSIAS